MGAATGIPPAGPMTSPASARLGLAGFLFGAAGMFATMYSTQAILPEIGRTFHVSPARAGLSVSAVVLAIAVGAWLWGPLSDRIGRRRALMLASTLLIAPTIAAGLAPTFGALIAARTLQGLCMPGLLTVGVPYLTEAFAPTLGARIMGSYIAALVAGGLVGRVGVALASGVVGWRAAVAGLAVLPLAAIVIMRRALPDVAPARSTRGLSAALGQLRNPRLLRPTVAAACLFFTFVGTFSYVGYRLERAPFGFGTEAQGLVFLLWVLGASGPLVGRVAERVGWRPVARASAACALVGILVTIPATLPSFLLGLGLITVAMFSGVTAAQIGLAEASSTDRGLASAAYFSTYYTAGALGGFVPGLAWQAWRWPGVAGLGVASALAALLALSLRAPSPGKWLGSG